MKITRESVAKEAGVTPTTVSCVLNNTRPVSDAVRKKVMDAIKKLNYVSDFSARGIKGKKTMQIVVIVDDLLNPFFASMVKGLEDIFTEKGYSLSISSERNLDKNISVLLARRVDAVYFCSEIQVQDWEKLSTLVENGIKVLTNPKIVFSREKSTMDMETAKAVREGIKYLTEKGHKEIAFLTNFTSNHKLDDRCLTFIGEMEKRSLKPRVVRLDQVNKLPSIELGRRLFEKTAVEHHEVTAVFGLNDLLTIGAMMQAKDMGYKIPEDISFIGIDGIYLSSIISPKLTTFACDMKSFCEHAFNLIIDAIDNDKYGGYVEPLKLVEGASVKDLNE